MKEDNMPHKIMITDDKGNNIEIGGVVKSNLIFPDEYKNNERSCSIDVCISSISKKKFIKMLMAKGIGRNGAAELARYFHKKDGIYDYINLLWL